MKVSIIGIGLIGGSLGLALRTRGLAEVKGFDSDEESLAEALSLGAIDSYSRNIEEAVNGSEIVFLATPINAIVPTAKKIVPNLPGGSILTDVGSVKSVIASGIEELIPEGIDFIGGHPMCGSERTGVQNSSPNLFQDAFYFLTPTPRTRTDSYQRLHSIITSLGANVISVEPSKHDEIVAIISHLPHLLAINLVNFSKKEGKEIENILEFAGEGFRDMTRIAASNPEMWSEIFSVNSSSIDSVTKRYWESINSFIEMMKRNDRGLHSEIEVASQTRKALDIRKDLSIENMRELQIEVLDKPGVISDITVTLGSVGINIEDIEIAHGAIPQGGLLKLIVADEETANRSAEILSKKGYRISIARIYEEGPE